MGLESKDDLHLKHHFAITTLTRARPTLRFPFPPLLCAHSCLRVSSKRKSSGWVGKGRFFFFNYYIYISSFKLLLEVRLDLPKQVCSVWPQQPPPPRSAWITGQPAQEARRSEVPQRGTEAAACRNAVEPLISVTLADISHSTCGGASPALTAATGASSCSFFWSLLSSVFTSNLPKGLALPPPASPFHHGQFGSQPKDLCQQ